MRLPAVAVFLKNGNAAAGYRRQAIKVQPPVTVYVGGREA